MARPDKLISDVLFPAWRAEREQLDRLDAWYRWDHDRPTSATAATREHRELADRSQTPLGNLIVTAAAQELYVEGYRRSDDPEDQGPWRAWRADLSAQGRQVEERGREGAGGGGRG